MTPNNLIHLVDREQSWHQRDAIHRLYQSGHLDAPTYLRRLRELDNPPAELRYVLPALLVFVVLAGIAAAVGK